MSSAGLWLNVFSAFVDANEKTKAAKQDAAQLDLTADEVEERGKEELGDYIRYGSAFLGSARAAQGASGLAMTGSPLLVDEATVKNFARGKYRIDRDTRYEAIDLRQQANKIRRRRGSFVKNFIGSL